MADAMETPRVSAAVYRVRPAHGAAARRALSRTGQELARRLTAHNGSVMNLPKTRLYRYDQLNISRPFAFDVDADDWLWEGLGVGHIGGHHLGTGEFRLIKIPEMGERVVFSAFSSG